MSKLVYFVTSSLLALSLSGCAGSPMITAAPTAATSSNASASPIAPVAQKDSVLAWASACEAWDQAKQVGAENLISGVIPAVDAPKAVIVNNAVSPLCTAYPSDPTSATTTIMEGVAELTQLAVKNKPTANIPSVVAKTTSAK